MSLCLVYVVLEMKPRSLSDFQAASSLVRMDHLRRDLSPKPQDIPTGWGELDSGRMAQMMGTWLSMSPPPVTASGYSSSPGHPAA